MELLLRKDMVLQDYDCVLCRLGVEESPLHLFSSCPVAVQCWALLHVTIGNLVDPFAILMRVSETSLQCLSLWKFGFSWVGPFRQLEMIIFFLNRPVQSNLQWGIRLGNTQSKGQTTLYSSFMARSLCVILLFFFFSIFVSWAVTLHSFLCFNKSY